MSLRISFFALAVAAGTLSSSVAFAAPPSSSDTDVTLCGGQKAGASCTEFKSGSPGSCVATNCTDPLQVLLGDNSTSPCLECVATVDGGTPPKADAGTTKSDAGTKDAGQTTVPSSDGGTSTTPTATATGTATGTGTSTGTAPTTSPTVTPAPLGSTGADGGSLGGGGATDEGCNVGALGVSDVLAGFSPVGLAFLPLFLRLRRRATKK